LGETINNQLHKLDNPHLLLTQNKASTIKLYFCKEHHLVVS
jgi:hypothetical protein